MDSNLNILPEVTVQLPIRNELFSVEGLLESVTRLDYPKDRFEIQILDDSEDSTFSKLQDLSQRYTDLGFNLQLLHRKKPKGFKAGALAEATPSAKGEFIAIFDADARPTPNFLKGALSQFEKFPEVGMVQGRLNYRNKEDSLLTRIQAVLLDGLMLEQEKLSQKKLPFQFNGNGGVWRRQCVDSIGGWRADTLVEDLDLSIRAQLSGWRFLFLQSISIETELPTSFRAFRNQQFRWICGSAQALRLFGRQILRSQLPSLSKGILLLRLIRRPLLHLFIALLEIGIPAELLFQSKKISVLSGFSATLVLVIFSLSYASWFRALGFSLKKLILILPACLGLYAGLSPHLFYAFLTGIRKKERAFIRTPKLGDSPLTNHFPAYSSPYFSSYSIDLVMGVVQVFAFIYLMNGGSPVVLLLLALTALSSFWVTLASAIS